MFPPLPSGPPLPGIYWARPGKRPPPVDAILIDQSEHVVSTIGSGYLQNFLSGGNVGKGIGILTQKRFYYKGKNYSGSGRGMRSTTQEGVVCLEDITFTLLTHVRHTGFLVFAILLTVAGVVCVVAASPRTIGLALLVAAIPFYILYFAKRVSVFQVCFPGGGFGFNIRWYPISDVRDFQRQLHLLKDHLKEEAAVSGMAGAVRDYGGKPAERHAGGRYQNLFPAHVPVPHVFWRCRPFYQGYRKDLEINTTLGRYLLPRKGMDEARIAAFQREFTRRKEARKRAGA